MTQTDLTIEDVDVDGALRESAERVAGDTRAGFIAKAAGATGALVGGALLVPGLADAQGSTALSATDTDILNFALTLEYLEANFYDQALKGGALSGDSLRFAQVAGKHETDHVKALQNTLGTAAVPQPAFDFKGTPTDKSQFLTTAITLEDTGVKAYKGQAPRLDSRDILLVALTIHSIEAKHAAWVRRIAGKTPVPNSLDKPLTKAQVLQAVSATGFITMPTYAG